MSRKWMYISVRVWGISAFISSLRSFWRTVDEIQQKTGMWHMMWRLLARLMCEMILLAWCSSQILFLKYSSFWGSLNPWISVRRLMHLEGIWLAAAGLVVIQMRAHGSSSPFMRFDINTPTDEISVTSETFWASENISDILLSSRPSKMNTTYTPHNLWVQFLKFRVKVQQKSVKTVLMILNQVQLSKWKHKHEIYILIGFSLCPVQNELLHRDSFSNSSNAFSKNSLIWSFFSHPVSCKGLKMSLQ